MFSFSKRKREKNGQFLLVSLSEICLLFLKKYKWHQNNKMLSKNIEEKSSLKPNFFHCILIFLVYFVHKH